MFRKFTEQTCQYMIYSIGFYSRERERLDVYQSSNCKRNGNKQCLVGLCVIDPKYMTQRLIVRPCKACL